MGVRKAISKTLRFKVFARDGFACQYCGAKPPAAILEVDHIVAVSQGGGDDEHNLLTACFDCNRGKGAKPLKVTPEDVSAKADMLTERMEQAVAYEQLLIERRVQKQAQIEVVVEVYERFNEGYTLTATSRQSVSDFLEKLPATVVLEAMEMACSRVAQSRQFKYFCGVCWRKIKGD